MDIFEITGFKEGVNKSGVSYLQPSDSFQKIEDGFVYRQVLQSRQGIGYYAPRLTNGTRVTGIFDFIQPDGTRELLVTDLNNMYTYNQVTGVFDLIPFAGGLAAYAGFNILNNENYISGVSYSDKNNGKRFVFTGNGIATAVSGKAIFYYDGTSILDFTVDNADFANPVEGNLIRAKHVSFFNQRLNFICPTIVSTQYNQGVLYSGIKSSSGNGDKFNVSGAGFFQFSTSEIIRSFKAVGQSLVFNLDKSTNTLDITADAFNPYRFRNIPSVIGSSASFSAVSWNNKVVSIGKSGIIEMDGRQSLRIDDNIPYFTSTEIDQNKFELIYGSIDPRFNQYLWTYLDNEGDNATTQNKVLVRNYEERSWSNYNLRLTCMSESELGLNLTWDEIDETAGNQSWSRWDTTEEEWDRIGQGNAVVKMLSGDDLGFIYEMNSGYDDYITEITAITNDSQAVLTVGACAIQVGDFVVVESVVGMLDDDGNSAINNYDPSTNQVDITLYEVLSATPTSITINVDTSLATAYTSGGRLSKPINFVAETIPLNPYRPIGRRINISHIEILLDNLSGSVKVDVLSNYNELPVISDVILRATDETIGQEWIPMNVNHETDFITFRFKQNSPSQQLKITSIRIHAEMGGETHG
jgi:hypothetical protein